MKERYLIRLFSVFILAGVIVPTYCLAGPIKAFSLREADRLLGEGHMTTGELETLGGITRFVGMVFDRENGDIILVGKVREDLPPVTIDDLVVALRCRLLSGQYPCVSIDMTDATAETGMQEVRFVGDIGQTQFGSDFLQSDVILKRYSLDLLQAVEGVTPYLKQYEADVVTSLEIDGRPVQGVRWFSEEDSRKKAEEYKGRNTIPGRTMQSRFWFHVVEDDSYIVEQDDVYVIEELRLGVKAETMQSAVGVEIEGANATDIAAEEFSRQFTEHYDEVCDANPALKRLKAMFDLVCIAEGVANLGDDRPRLDALLSKYSVGPRETPREYSLVHRVGEVKCESGDVVLCQLSGGISLEAVLMALEDGDVSGLKLAVLGTRPSEDALCWTLPLDEWEMPNNEPEETDRPNVAAPHKLEVHLPGFSLAAQSYVFPKDKTGLETSAFTGFDAPASTSPLQESRPQFQRHERLTISSENTKLQEALLAEDWERVVGLFQNVDIKTADPILRFVKAHACLATNRNNESVGLFSVASLDDLDMWEQWCQRFTTEHRRDPVASYFLGDACARFMDYTKAVEYFTRSIEQDEDSYLALNARGTVYVVIGEYDKALADLLKARAIKPNCADVYNTLAMINIRQKKGLIANSKNSFLGVLKINPSCALAFHGLGCMELLESRDVVSPEDNRNIQMALNALPEAVDLFVANETRYIEAAIGKQADTMYADSGSQGTALKREYRIQALANAADRVATLQAGLPSNTSDFHRQMVQSRVFHSQTAVANEFLSMSAPQRQEFARRDPEGAGKTLNALTQLSNTYGRNTRKYAEAVQQTYTALDNLGRIPGFSPITSIVKASTRPLGDRGIANLQRNYEIADRARTQQLNAIGNAIRQEIRSGTYRPAAIPDQTLKSRISQSPPGYAESLGVRKYTPPGGATTDKTLITWNAGEWPFAPIFGLLYYTPQIVDDAELPMEKGDVR